MCTCGSGRAGVGKMSQSTTCRTWERQHGCCFAGLSGLPGRQKGSTTGKSGKKQRALYDDRPNANIQRAAGIRAAP